MLSPTAFRRRFVRTWLTRKTVWMPLALGLTCAVAAVAGAAGLPGLGAAAGVLFGLGVGLVGLGALSAAAWWGLGKGKLAQEVQSELLEEADGGQRQLLKQLGARLIGHGDTDGARLADALRRLDRRLDEGVAGKGFEVDPRMAGTAERLMDASVNALARSLSIHQAREKLHTEQVRAELDQTRAELVEEVGRGVDALGLMLDKLQTAGLRQPLPGELPAVRSELDAGLAVAERVEARMAELERSLSGPSAVGERR